MYNTGRSHANDVLLQVSCIVSLVRKPAKPFVLSFTYDAPMNWNAVPDDYAFSHFSLLIQKEVENPSLSEILFILVFLLPQYYSLALNHAMSLWPHNNEYLLIFMTFLRVCLKIEIKCYKSIIRITICSSLLLLLKIIPYPQ